MKITSLLLIFVSLSLVTLNAQEKKPLSPPMTLEASIDGAEVTVEYSAPSMRGRSIFGDLVPYGKVWRTGANDATRITFASAATIEGENIPAGTYSLFTIPTVDKWTIIFNKKANQWGHYGYSDAEDQLRVEVTPVTLSTAEEMMVFEATEKGIVLKWDKLSVPVNIAK